ncbi:hypothetical protein, partial [Pantoea sp. CTOTU50773]|uniref:hypothetical protein n=1 Tax=Pantoea sp. CTOTU50773 TaxID=2953853 RepID=UPI0028B00B21
LNGSTAQRLNGSTAQRLNCSTAQLLNCSTAQLLTAHPLCQPFAAHPAKHISAQSERRTSSI